MHELTILYLMTLSLANGSILVIHPILGKPKGIDEEYNRVMGMSILGLTRALT
jgi:hypothetical protein